MAFVLDLLRQADDVLITAELAVVVVSALLLIASTALGRFSGQNAAADGASIVVGAAGFLVHMAGRWNLARAFGRGPLFSLGMVLFPPLFTLILGLGGSEYQGPRAAQRG